MKQSEQRQLSSLQLLGKRISKEIGLDPMPTERNPETGRFDPPGFYFVKSRTARTSRPKPEANGRPEFGKPDPDV